jgi:photosystem II stability/assembly factor-like uncharacterized protein
VGYVFDPGLFMTTDGGHTWAAQASRPVAALEAMGGDVVRITYSHTGCPGPCDWNIERAPVGSPEWRVVSIPAVNNHNSVQLIRQERDAYAAFFGNTASGAGTQQAELLVSPDGGSTWGSRPDPCGFSGKSPNDAIAIAGAPGGVVGALCTPRGTSEPGNFTIISVDRARTFGRPRALPPIDAPSAVALTGPSGVVVANGEISGSGPFTYVLYTSHDGGQHWTRAVSETQPVDRRLTDGMFLGFQTATVGRWIGDPSTNWTTTDAGDHWIPHRFRGP